MDLRICDGISSLHEPACKCEIAWLHLWRCSFLFLVLLLQGQLRLLHPADTPNQIEDEHGVPSRVAAAVALSGNWFACSFAPVAGCLVTDWLSSLRHFGARQVPEWDGIGETLEPLWWRSHTWLA